jgi:asparaginyl-tRNA synthetase
MNKKSFFCMENFVIMEKTKRTKIKEILSLDKVNEKEVIVKGWVRTKRESKNVSFFEVNDGSSLASLQVVIDLTNFTTPEVLNNVTTGASVTVKGKLVSSPGGNQAVELLGSEVTVHGQCPVDSYPLQKKRHSLEYLREIAHLIA